MTSHDRVSSHSPSFSVRALVKKDLVELWLYRDGRPVKRHTTLLRRFVLDAWRHGQDVIEDAISTILLDIESRRSTVLRGRRP
jgi:hypothetical protein